MAGAFTRYRGSSVERSRVHSATVAKRGTDPDVMNEYEVTVSSEDGVRKLTLEAETASQARDRAEDETEAEVVQVRFVRALTFSCRMRGGQAGEG